MIGVVHGSRPTRRTALAFELEHTTLVEDGARREQFGPGATGIGGDLAGMGLGIHLGSGQACRQAGTPAPQYFTDR